MMLSFFGDVIVAVLLVATISYAAVLNRRLGILRGDRAKLEELVQGLTIATQRAEMGVAGLKAAAEESGRELEKRIERAQNLRDDLSYMVERGGALADRLENTIRTRRDEPPPEVKPERRAEPRVEPVAARAPEPRTSEPARPSEPARTAELPRVLQILRGEVLARGEGRAASAAGPEDDAARRTAQTSRAERDLLRALGGRR